MSGQKPMFNPNIKHRKSVFYCLVWISDVQPSEIQTIYCFAREKSILEKCTKHSPAARAFYISLVFSTARRVLLQCNTRLRLHYLLNRNNCKRYRIVSASICERASRAFIFVSRSRNQVFLTRSEHFRDGKHRAFCKYSPRFQELQFYAEYLAVTNQSTKIFWDMQSQALKCLGANSHRDAAKLSIAQRKRWRLV